MAVARVDVALRGLELGVAHEQHHDFGAPLLDQARTEAVPERMHAVRGQAGIPRGSPEHAPLGVDRQYMLALPRRFLS